MSFNWSRSLKFKISFIFAILIAVAFTLNWMVALHTMRSEKMMDLQKVLNHVLNESNDEYLSSPLTPQTPLTFLYSIPHNQMILDDSEASNLRFIVSKTPYAPKENEIFASLKQRNGFYFNAISDTRKMDAALDKYGEKLLIRYLFSLLAILIISILLLHYYMKSLALLAYKTQHWQSGDPFDFSLHKAESEIEEVSKSFGALIRRLELFRTKETELFKEAAHELKTPLALMRSRLDVYETTTTYAKEKFVTDLGSDIERLSTELKNVLFLESSDFEDPIVVDLAKALKKILYKVEILSHRKQLTLALPTQTFTITVAEKLLHKVLMALIENAMTYAQEGSTISIELDPLLRTLSVTNTIGDEKYLFSSKIGQKMLKRLSEELHFNYDIMEDQNNYTIKLTFLQPLTTL